MVTPLEVKGPQETPQGGFVCRTEGSREPFPFWDANPKVVDVLRALDGSGMGSQLWGDPGQEDFGVFPDSCVFPLQLR